MASTATQAIPNGSPLYQNFTPTFTPGQLSADIDMVSVFPEFLGIPYDIFRTTSNPPANHPWTVAVKKLASDIKATGKPILLQTVLARDKITARAIDNNGTLKVEPDWAPRCADFTNAAYSSLGTSYTNYVSYMAKLFRPSHYVVMIEFNLYYVLCGGDTPSWRSFMTTERNAYLSAKLSNFASVVYPSFKLEDLYGQDLNGFDTAQYQVMNGSLRDRFGIATYPYGVQVSPGVFANPYQLPSDYLVRVKNRYPNEKRIVITETGWITDPISFQLNGCFANFVYSDSSYALAFMQLMILSAYVGDFEAITWWSSRDLIQGSVMSTCYPVATPPTFPECNGDPWCQVISQTRAGESPGVSAAFLEMIFKAFGTMGYRTYDGTPKPGLYDLWKQFLALPKV